MGAAVPHAHGRGHEVLDLGTGSGAIALAWPMAAPAHGSVPPTPAPAALHVALDNACRLGLSIDGREGSLVGAVAGRRFDLAVSNPPHIAEGDPHLPSLCHEPLQALESGRRPAGPCDIIDGASAHLRPGAWLLLSMATGQAERCASASSSRASSTWTRVMTSKAARVAPADVGPGPRRDLWPQDWAPFTTLLTLADPPAGDDGLTDPLLEAAMTMPLQAPGPGVCSTVGAVARGCRHGRWLNISTTSLGGSVMAGQGRASRTVDARRRPGVLARGLAPGAVGPAAGRLPTRRAALRADRRIAPDQRPVVGPTPGLSTADTDAHRLALRGLGYSGNGARGDWETSADFGMAGPEPGRHAAPGPGGQWRPERATRLRDLRLQPVVRLGMSRTTSEGLASAPHGCRRLAGRGNCTGRAMRWGYSHGLS